MNDPTPGLNRIGSLRILFSVRDDLLSAPGGDTIQVVQTARALQKLGVAVEISASIDATWDRFDLIHLWHLERVHETYGRFLQARRLGIPTVLSPIYWPLTGSASPGRVRVLLENVKNSVRLALSSSGSVRGQIALACRRGWRRCREEILKSSCLVLPNSAAEAAVLQQEAGGTLRCRVITNGIDPDECQRVLDEPTPRRAGVLCVGHFDTRKNQLRLILALSRLDVPLSFVGGARRWHRCYHRACRWMAGANTKFLGVRSHVKVLRLMRASLVHVCPSHYETPGLVNLEAAALGCRLVLADSPPVREYFGDQAAYFMSRDVAAMRRAVLQALHTSPSTQLALRVVQDYTWGTAARQTLGAYAEVLNRETIVARAVAA